MATEDKPRRNPFAGLGLSRRALARAFSELRGAGPEHTLAPDLPEDDLPFLRRKIDDCLAARGGVVSARARAAELGRAYLALDQRGRTRFLSLLAKEYGPNRDAMAQASEAFAQAGAAQFPSARRALTAALTPPRLALLKQFNSLEQGVKFLVDLRADLLRQSSRDPDLAALDVELHELLSAWFDIGFLDLQRITWDAPAALLEKLVAYEAVHEIKSWGDLKDRLDSDRRCYAFFHPAMPNEPLIFVEVALVNGLAADIHILLDETAPAQNPEKADTAIFYSISNAQAGLQGVGFGDFLIKRVVDVLAHDFPKLKTFATLSPVPGFSAWLKQRLTQPEPLLTPDESAAIARVGPSGATPALAQILARPDWHSDAPIQNALRPILLRLCAHYLTREKRGGTGAVARALDPVAHFHLTNGARVERINWLADLSKNGIAQSAGMMVNYLYRLNEIEHNHEAYRARGHISAGSGIRVLL